MLSLSSISFIEIHELFCTKLRAMSLFMPEDGSEWLVIKEIIEII